MLSRALLAIDAFWASLGVTPVIAGRWQRALTHATTALYVLAAVLLTAQAAAAPPSSPGLAAIRAALAASPAAALRQWSLALGRTSLAVTAALFCAALARRALDSLGDSRRAPPMGTIVRALSMSVVEVSMYTLLDLDATTPLLVHPWGNPAAPRLVWPLR